MAHMMQVDFVTNHANGTIERGKILVLADSHEQAHDVVCQQMQLPPSRTRCESVKIKPPIYTLQNSQAKPDKKPSRETGNVDRHERERVHYNATVVVSNVVAHDHRQALRKIGEELTARGMQAESRHHLKIQVECAPSGANRAAPEALSPLEKIEMYGRRSGSVQGGQVRSR